MLTNIFEEYMHKVERFHDISCGHRVVGHESKCQYLHGHNYRIHFTCVSEELDNIGRVIDFSVIKEKLCMWLEENYDHKMLIWYKDPLLEDLKRISNDSIVVLPFNPTAENIAEHLVKVIAPTLLKDTCVELIECKVEETRKCSAIYSKEKKK
jgi:6-pyruvoyltetrahydropterin/6-carboxytetrahydropterin synthase